MADSDRTVTESGSSRNSSSIPIVNPLDDRNRPLDPADGPEQCTANDANAHDAFEDFEDANFNEDEHGENEDYDIDEEADNHDFDDAGVDEEADAVDSFDDLYEHIELNADDHADAAFGQQ